jgi:hypothetical protein
VRGGTRSHPHCDVSFDVRAEGEDVTVGRSDHPPIVYVEWRDHATAADSWEDREVAILYLCVVMAVRIVLGLIIGMAVGSAVHRSA